MDGRDGSEPLGGFLGAEVALGLGEQLVADHELAHGRPQERRVEMRVELPVGVGLSVERGLVPAHRVGERQAEEVVVAAEQLDQDVGQRIAGRPGQVRQPVRPAASG